MKNIIAIGGSNSKNSINKIWASYVASQVENAAVKVLDLNDYSLPLYGIDYETENGIPAVAQSFLDEIKQSDGIVISLAEHNGVYSVAFKNIFDWMSRIDGKLWSDIPMLLMATSPGGRGGQTVLEIAENKFPRMGAKLTGVFSLPSFYDNFKDGELVNLELKEQLSDLLSNFSKEL